MTAGAATAPANPPRSVRWRHLAAILVMAVLASGFSAWILNRDIQLQIGDRQSALVEVLRERLSRETGHIATVQSAAVALISQTPDISQRAFAERMTPIMQAEPSSGVRAVALTAPVPGSAIASALATAYPDANRWPGAPVAIAPAGPRDLGFPALRVAPEAGNLAVAGFDLWADPARRAAAELALATGGLIGSAPVVLSQDSEVGSDTISLLAVRPYGIGQGTPWGDGVGLVASGYTLPAATLFPNGGLQVRISDLGLVGEPADRAVSPTVLFDSVAGACLFCVRSTVETRFLERRWEVTLVSPYLQADPVLAGSLFLLPLMVFALILMMGGWWSSLVRSQQELAGKVADQTAELTRAYKDVQVSLQEAQEAIRSQRLFLQTMSHELRTPLNAILGTSEMMGDPTLRKLKILEDAEAWQRVQLAGTRLHALVEALLFLSDIDRGAVASVPRAVTLSDVFQDSSTRLRRLHEATDLPVIYEGETEIGLETDPDLLAQALVALIDNGLKAGGPVTVTVTRVDGAPLIAIRDRGPGLSADAEATLFQRFAMSSDMDVKSRGGLGLGLATVAELSRLLGFSVSLRNHPDGGVEATVGLHATATAPPVVERI